MQAVLSIAGSDSSGGAGIQADIKTIAAHGLYAETAITALTAQNTTGVFGVVEVDPEFVARQIDTVFEDIRPAAVKVGMVPSADMAWAIACSLERNGAENVVVDPVMVSTSGAELVCNEAADALVKCLFPLASVVTPNLAEARALSGVAIMNERDIRRAANVIAHRIASCIRYVPATRLEGGGAWKPSGVKKAPAHGPTDVAQTREPAILVKGGHCLQESSDTADDLLRLADNSHVWLRGARVDTENAHGTGCTLSSAIACGLAMGMSVEQAVSRAKSYVAGALAAGLNLGRRSGPLDHMWEPAAARTGF